jgi:prevent-host-death family protein
MHTVSISELKARLSKYIGIVRRGGEVQILDRGTPVARLTSLRGNARADRWERLVGSGVLRPGSGEAAVVLAEPPLLLDGADVAGALEDERGDRL